MSALTIALLVLAAPPSKAADDPVFGALAGELERARGLSMPGAGRPYYLAAFFNEEEIFHVSASFGSLSARGDDRRGQLNVTVRVGDPSLDNTGFAGGGGDFFSSRGPAGAPAEVDYDALRQALWLKFDEAYKSAVESIAKKKAYLETNQVKDRPPDFAPAEVATQVEPRVPLSLDRERWTRLVKAASAQFRARPEVHSCQVSLRATASHQSMVSSDPSRHRFSESRFTLTLSASGQAPDGMELTARHHQEVRLEAELPKDEEVLASARALAERLSALVKAPVAPEDYTGPVLFTGEAAAVFFLQTIGDPLSSPRDDLGDSRQGRLVDRLGKHVATKRLTARDDPTLEDWKGAPLLGHFAIDDDGVRPRPITLVKDGVLETYYMSRVPTKRVKESNGHSRAGDGSVGSLFVETDRPTPRVALKKRLLELAAEEDLGYGLLVEQLEDPRHSRNASSISLPEPLVVWRVYPDGREVLERGASFKPANFRILKDIEAIGDEPAVLNTTHRGQRVSVVAPAVLVKLLELQRTREEFEKPPYSARPPLFP